MNTNRRTPPDATGPSVVSKVASSRVFFSVSSPFRAEELNGCGVISMPDRGKIVLGLAFVGGQELVR